MNTNEAIGLSLSVLILSIITLYMFTYNPSMPPIRKGECIEFREARQQGLFISSVECIKWKE